MNDNNLAVYLNDHLGALVGVVELARRCQSENAGTDLGHYLSEVLSDLQEDRRLVGELVNRIGAPQDPVKRSAAWLAEKLARLKLNNGILSYSPLSRVEELEVLAVAARDRHEMWNVLRATRSEDPRFEDVAFDALCERAVKNAEELDLRLVQAAMEAFGPGSVDAPAGAGPFGRTRRRRREAGAAQPPQAR